MACLYPLSHGHENICVPIVLAGVKEQGRNEPGISLVISLGHINGIARMLFGRRKRRITRLLVVEDEPLVAFDTEHFLTDAGFVIVATVDRVADAIGLIDSGTTIDLVLVDVSLADGSGLDVARAARARAVPVLFVTGNCPAEARELAAGCLAKPYAQRDLQAAIQAIDTVLAGGTPRRSPPGFRLFVEA